MINHYQQLNDLQEKQTVTYLKQFPKINTNKETYDSIIAERKLGIIPLLSLLLSSLSLFSQYSIEKEVLNCKV